MHLLELVFLQDVLCFPNNSAVAFREVIKRSEDVNAASVVSGLQRSVFLLYKWQLLREGQRIIKDKSVEGFEFIYIVILFFLKIKPSSAMSDMSLVASFFPQQFSPIVSYQHVADGSF